MLHLQDITYVHPNKDVLFSNLNLTINKNQKVALVGNNGAGKTTLLNLLAGKLRPLNGLVKAEATPYYIPQLFDSFNQSSIAQALGINDRFCALKEILNGNISDENLALLNEGWSIEERCLEAFAYWNLEINDLHRNMESLSGGQKSKVFLAGIHIHQPQIVLMDEPSNHLDLAGRKILYEYIRSTSTTLVVVSHDRTLLNLLDTVFELSSRGITQYGGNYDFYTEQKKIEADALDHEVRNKEKALRKAKEVERETLQRQQKLDARGKKKQAKEGLPTISMNTFRNNAEKSTSRIKGVHEDKVVSIYSELSQLRQSLPDIDQIKLDFDHSKLPIGKIIVTAQNINYGYDHLLLWREGLSFKIACGERISISGTNGSGKTTLLKMILDDLQPKTGSINSAATQIVYIDQEYFLIKNNITVYEQAQLFNIHSLQEHEIKIRLNRFLFTKEYWNKPCAVLSGGERMRLLLCSLSISHQAPDVMILDEPTNNLDIQNIEVLTSAIRNYKGTLLVISHDTYFLNQINVNRDIRLD